jgi:hypothetical protein
MRKLTTLCCLAALFGTSFLSCQKNESDLLSIETTFPSSTNRDVSTVSHHVLELTNQSFDYQHFTINQNPSDTVQPTLNLNNTSRFALTYFNIFEGEQERIYTLTSLKSTLMEAGLSEKEAQKRTDRIFNTSSCSPAYLTETAQLMSPTLPSHTEGAFICELYKPFDLSQIETLFEKSTHNDVAKILYKKTGLAEKIKNVHKLVGVSGSIVAHGNSRVDVIYNVKDVNTPLTLRLEPQEVRLILQARRGFTEGEVIYLKLILGGLTEQEVWQLFETDIFPELQTKNRMDADKKDDLRFSRLFFRYNYVEITGNTGRLGYTVYDLEGFTNDNIIN